MSFEIASRRPGCNVPACPKPKAVKVVTSSRSRPPKCLRQLPSLAGPFDSVQSRVSLDRIASKVRRPKAVHAEVEEVRGFSHSYLVWIRKQFVVHGTFGPCDIYDPCLPGLLVRWCGSKGSEVDWHVVERKWNVGCGPAAVFKFIHMLKGRRARCMATRNVNRGFVARNLPKTFGHTFKVPRESCLNVVKHAISEAVRYDPQWNHDEKVWLLSRLRLIPGPARKHSHLCNAQTVSKRTCAQEVVELPGHYLDSFDKARNLDRVEKIWDVPLRPSVHEDAFDVSACVRRCCSCIHVDKGHASEAASTAAQGLLIDPCYMREQRIFKQTHNAYISYTADMSRCPGEVLVPDDKQRKFMWKVPILCYQWLLLKFACLSPTWELTTLTPEEAETSIVLRSFIDIYKQGYNML